MKKYNKWLSIAIVSNFIFAYVLLHALENYIWEDYMISKVLLTIVCVGSISLNCFIILKNKLDEDYPLKKYFAFIVVIPILILVAMGLLSLPIWNLYYTLFGSWTIV